MAFSANQRTYRKERHLTQQQLADALDVSLGVISKLENGVSTPDLSILIEMAEVFRVSTDALFGAKLSLKKSTNTWMRFAAHWSSGIIPPAESL